MLKINFLLLLMGIFFQAKTQQNQSFDYQKIKTHPRLFLLGGEEILVQKAINKSVELQKVSDYIIQESDKMIDQPNLVYQKIGRRLLGVSRAALTRLYYLSFSYRMTREDKYLQRANQELNNLCDFKDWNPSHFLDVGEMSMAIAIAYDWLYDDLPISTKTKIRQAIVEKAFKPSYNKSYAWFLTAENNWNSVCNSGLTMAALAIMEDEKEQAIPIIERALKSVERPLKAYAPDGNYPEGPSYWNYGTAYQMMLSAGLESALGSDNGLAQFPGFMNSAYYMNFAQGPTTFDFNYADGGQNNSGNTSLFWFAQKENNPTLIYQELALIRQGKYTGKLGTGESRMLPNVLVFAKNLDLTDVKPLKQHFFMGQGVTPVAMVRTDWEQGKGLYLGLKAGKASAPHAHQDQGSFVYDIGNLRWAMDFGAQNYNSLETQGVNLWSMAQNSQRWEIFRYNNLNHNTLSINNQLQNVKAKANFLEKYDHKTEQGAKVDLTEVLNLNMELKSAIRKAVIVDNKFLQIEDEMITNEKEVNLRWNMVTPAKAEIIDSQTIKLSQKGKELYLKFESALPLKLVIRPSENPSEIINESTGKNYADYNEKNIGTCMLGFDVVIPAKSTAVFKTIFIEK